MAIINMMMMMMMETITLALEELKGKEETLHGRGEL